MASLGTVLKGRYRLSSQLGEGSAGSVWEADDTRVGRRIAVKILHSELATHPEIRARFLAEARASERIAHPNVVDVFDDGEMPDGTPFMAMELCDGETLDTIVELRGAVGPIYACELLAQVLSALEAAHGLGIVHRDLKPANIMVVHPRPSQPVTKVLDFGIAKGVHPDGSELDEQGRVFGTPTYMAPEQAAGDEVDSRADVYAAGAILYELLTGRPPFVGDSPAIVLAEVLTRPPMPMRAFDRSIPKELEQVVRSVLAKDPADRPPTASALRGAIAPWIPSPRDSFPSIPDHGSERPLPLVAVSAGKTVEKKAEPPRARLVLTDSAPPPADDVASRDSAELVSPSDFDELDPVEVSIPPMDPPLQGASKPPAKVKTVPRPTAARDSPEGPASKRLQLVSDSSVPPALDDEAGEH